MREGADESQGADKAQVCWREVKRSEICMSEERVGSETDSRCKNVRIDIRLEIQSNILSKQRVITADAVFFCLGQNCFSPFPQLSPE